MRRLGKGGSHPLTVLMDLFIRFITDSHWTPNTVVITVSEIATSGLTIEFSIELNNVREYVMTEEQDD